MEVTHLSPHKVGFLARRPTEEDVAFVAENLRPADLSEAEALGMGPAAPLLLLTVKQSLWFEAIQVDGQVAALYGLGREPRDVGQGVGLPWLMGTSAADAFGFKFIRDCRKVVGRMLEDRPALVNFVHVKNERAIRWIEWLGFEFHPPLMVPATGAWLLPFHIARPGADQLATNYIEAVRGTLAPRPVSLQAAVAAANKGRWAKHRQRTKRTSAPRKG